MNRVQTRHFLILSKFEHAARGGDGGGRERKTRGRSCVPASLIFFARCSARARGHAREARARGPAASISSFCSTALARDWDMFGDGSPLKNAAGRAGDA